MVWYNWATCDEIEVFPMLLNRFPYPCCYFKFKSLFGRATPKTYLIFNNNVYGFYINFHHLLDTFKHSQVSSQNFDHFWASQKVQRSAAIIFCGNNFDKTVQQIWKRKLGEKNFFIWRPQKIYEIELQPGQATDELIANLSDSVECFRYVNTMLNMLNPYS